MKPRYDGLMPNPLFAYAMIEDGVPKLFTTTGEPIFATTHVRLISEVNKCDQAFVKFLVNLVESREEMMEIINSHKTEQSG